MSYADCLETYMNTMSELIDMLTGDMTNLAGFTTNPFIGMGTDEETNQRIISIKPLDKIVFSVTVNTETLTVAYAEKLKKQYESLCESYKEIHIIRRAFQESQMKLIEELKERLDGLKPIIDSLRADSLI